MHLREGNNERKLFEGVEEARAERGKTRHGKWWVE
jgi:hypothetical protein